MKLPPHLFVNRELSWLAFNRRVLDEARDPRNPLLERVKFLAISASNLDEFFEIRVGGLLQQAEAGIDERGPDGMSPEQQLAAIAREAHVMVTEQSRCWSEQLIPELDRAGVSIRKPAALEPSDREFIDHYSATSLLPVLTPVTVDPAHPFPRVRNKALCIAVLLENHDEEEPHRLGVVTVPSALPRLLRLPIDSERIEFVFLADLVQSLVGDLFHGYRVLETAPFRVTRNSNLYLEEDEVEDLISAIEAELRNRRKGEAVRLEVAAGASDDLVKHLQKNFELEDHQIYRINGPVNLARVLRLYVDTPRPDLKDEPYNPPEATEREPDRFFEDIRRRDQLLHHPYDSFTAVVEFVGMAALDPRVLAIKQTVYRTGDDPRLMKALIDAADAGKEVTVVVELKARFDEEANIRWARRLEDAGVQVVYGLVGLKTHCKLSLLVRQEGDMLRRYTHLSTGNYNASTARLYTDIGVITAREDITSDVAEVFNVLTSLSPKPRLRRLLLAPFGMLRAIVEHIQREARHARAGRPARIVAKMNALLDPDVIAALYEASTAGVKIDLIIRGICALRPGLPGISENIRVVSIVGRFLEHSRIFSFENGGEPEVWLGSADWMPRNLRARVEVLFPIDDPALQHRIRSEILSLYMADSVKAREVLPDGQDRRRMPVGEGTALSSQEAFMLIAHGRPVKIPDAFSTVPGTEPAPTAPAPSSRPASDAASGAPRPGRREGTSERAPERAVERLPERLPERPQETAPDRPGVGERRRPTRPAAGGS